MAAKSRLVNLDAMIPRADFAIEPESQNSTFETIPNIGLRDLAPDSMVVPILRKPDFQRETNHWVPEQVVSLLECFINGDLIPSVILWRSPTYLFVIDGGHRLSALMAWVEDDYGDGPRSKSYFGETIGTEHKKAAQLTRDLIAKRVGTWKHIQANRNHSSLTPEEQRRLNTIVSRALPIQWVQGNAEKAEASFFKINTKGTPLDNLEELLLSCRRRPISIASRAVIRAGMGHKYWSQFAKDKQVAIETLAKKLHNTLFEPEVQSPVKTLDLPLGGPVGVRSALQILMEFILVASRNQQGTPVKIADQDDDTSGDQTVIALQKATSLANWITGNDRGSLGLHPAIYFYGPSGRHVSPLFMGTAVLFAKKLASNDKGFFAKFSSVRGKLEAILIEEKDLLATILQKMVGPRRIDQYAGLLDAVIQKLSDGESIDQEKLVELAGLEGKVIVGKEVSRSERVSDDTKSAVFIRTALIAAAKCPICHGYLDPTKSVSYDHVKPVRDGGTGSEGNIQLTHPYCNQSVKR